MEYRLREVVQDAQKFMRRSKRNKLSTEDINSALRLKRVEPLYGFFSNAEEVPFQQVPGQPELFYEVGPSGAS